MTTKQLKKDILNICKLWQLDFENEIITKSINKTFSKAIFNTKQGKKEYIFKNTSLI